MSYQEATGPLMANSHPGSYCGQDAYNDMFVTEKQNDIHNSKTGLSHEGVVEYGIRPNGNRLQGSTNNYENRGGCDMETVVRRLTPLECERLQGFPDNWTLIGEATEVEVKDYKYTYDEDGNVATKELVGTHKEIGRFFIDADGKRKKVSDSARYKALGNSIALPFWFYLLRRISAQYERPATLGSLFDGIGGFPYCWERCNGEGTAIWASEIEEFPIAVTKEHFPEGAEQQWIKEGDQ